MKLYYCSLRGWFEWLDPCGGCQGGSETGRWVFTFGNEAGWSSGWLKVGLSMSALECKQGNTGPRGERGLTQCPNLGPAEGLALQPKAMAIPPAGDCSPKEPHPGKGSPWCLNPQLPSPSSCLPGCCPFYLRPISEVVLNPQADGLPRAHRRYQLLGLYFLLGVRARFIKATAVTQQVTSWTFWPDFWVVGVGKGMLQVEGYSFLEFAWRVSSHHLSQ